MPEAQDLYANQAYLKVIESAANTLTFEQLLTGISIYEKLGWIIARMEYQLDINSTNFGATADAVNFGLATSNAFATAGMEVTPVIDINTITRIDIGTAASGFIYPQPIVKDFSMLPGGGLLIPPNPIYIWVKGTALTSAVTVKARMYYTVKKLKTEDYWELVELRRMIGA